MPELTRKDRRELEAFADKLPNDGARRLLDLVGPAVYELEPFPRTAALCSRCRYVSLILTLPAKPTTWECPRCGAGYPLMPPLEVLAYGRAGQDRLSRAIARLS